MASPSVLLYDPVPSPWAPKLRQICAIQGLRLRAVETSDLERSVGDLAQGGRISAPAGENSPLPESLFVFCHLSSAGLDRLLQALRKAGVPRSCLKAVLTPTNSGWTLRALYEELVKERAQFS